MLQNNVSRKNKGKTEEFIVKVTTDLPKFKLPKKPQDDIDKAINTFLTGQVGKFGKYVAVANALVYRTIITSNYGNDVEMGQDIVALRIEKEGKTLFIGNSSILKLIGRTSNWGNESFNREVTEVQKRLSRHIQMIPFSVFTEANLNLMNIKILDRGPEKTVVRNEEKYDARKRENVKVPVEVHFTGASLFSVDDRLFLFDIDQREIKHKIFNAFLVELKVPAKTIAEAYQTLKPKAVVDAEKKGLEVLRQGEWFFIPVKGNYETVMRTIRGWNGSKDKVEPMPVDLKAGNNRPNKAAKHAKEGKTVYVTGKVTHSGREHADLLLKGWYEPVANTSVQSFTLVGDVD